MSSNRVFESNMERELTNNQYTRNGQQTVDPSVYLRTAAGDIIQLEIEIGWKSPYVSDAMECGFGFNWRHPICLSRAVEKEAVEMIFGYFRYSTVRGRSHEECQLFLDELLKKDERTLWKLLRAANFLQVEWLFKMIRDTLAQNTEKSVREVEKDLFEQCAKGEKLDSLKNVDVRTRLSTKLFAKQKKKLDEMLNIKNDEAEVEAKAEVEAPKREDHSIDDLLSFINGDEDTKGGQTSKKKKTNRNKRKEKKKTSSISSFASTEAPASEKVTENSEQDLNASDFANHRGSAGDLSQLPSTQHESSNFDEDTVDKDVDIALLKAIDREVEDFSYRLSSRALESQRNEILSRIRAKLCCMMGSDLYVSKPPENGSCFRP